MKRDRQVSLCQINFALPNLNAHEILIKAYFNTIYSIIETFRLKKIFKINPIKTIEKPILKFSLGDASSNDLSFVQELIDKNIGAICLGSHLSNFELMTAFFSYQGLKMSVIARSPNRPLARKILTQLRLSYGIDILWREDKKSSSQLLNAIKNNRMICALIDQDIDLENGFSKFFGLDAAHPIAPIKIALKFNRPILLCNIKRERNFKYTLLIQRVNWEDKPNPLQYILDEYSKNLQRLTMDSPGQWVWWHRRWRRREGIDYKKYPEKLISTSNYISWLNNIKLNY
jgi:lauroyl/myristoyl acyltransferase